MLDSRFDFVHFFDIEQINIPIKFKKKNFIKIWKKNGININVTNQIKNVKQYSLNIFSNRFVKVNSNYDEYVLIPSFNNPRWIIKNNDKIIKNHGPIIKPSTFKAKFIWEVAKILNKIGFFNLIFPDRFIVASGCLSNFFSKSSVVGCEPQIIYTGAPGNYQKFTIKIIKKDINYYFKSAFLEKAKKRIVNEKNALLKLKKIKIDKIKFPFFKELYSKNDFSGILLTNIINNDEVMSHNLHKIDFYFFRKMFFCSENVEIPVIDYINRIEFNKLNQFFDNIILEKINNKKILLSMSHGDYTPWNRFIDGNIVKIIDWENFKYRPLYYDLVYFIVNKYTSSQNISIESIKVILIKNVNDLDIGLQFRGFEKRIYILIILIEIFLHYANNNYRGDNKIMKYVKDLIFILKREIDYR